MLSLKNYKYYIADGFSDDCDSLIRNCLEGDRKVTYPIFCEVWKEMNFGCLYQGRNIVADIAELSEEVLQVAKEFMLIDSEIFEEIVAAVFLVYGLVKLQPYPGFAALRLCPENVESIRRIETIARKENRLDVLYVLGSLLTEAQFHADSRERGMEWTLKKYFEGYGYINRPRSRGVLHRQNKIHQVVKELSNFSEEYVHLKMQLQDFTSSSLNYWDAAFPKKISSSLKMLSSSNSGNSSQADSRNESFKLLTSRLNEESSTRTVHAIREKAMKNTVSPIKHLVAVHERCKGRRKINHTESEEVGNTTKNVKSPTDDRIVTKSRRDKIGIATKDKTKDEDVVEKTESTTVFSTKNFVIEFIEEGNNSGLPDLNAVGLLDMSKGMPDLTGGDVAVETAVKQSDEQSAFFETAKRKSRKKNKGSPVKKPRPKNPKIE